MKLGQKVRTIARKAGFKVSVAATQQTATISLINGDVPAFLELCMKKYPKGIMSAEGKSFTFEVSEPWPVKQSEPKVSQPDEPQLQVIPIKNINKITEIHAGYDLVVFEKGQDPVTQGLVLHDFTEVGMFSTEIKKPVYCFVKGEEPKKKPGKKSKK